MTANPPVPSKQRAPRIRNLQYLRPLGSGGTCWVYLYQQLQFRRRVAVKVSKQRASRTSHELFLKEATFMARLSEHPSILSIFSAGVSKDGHNYIVMEYAPGGNYKRIMKTSRLSEQQALDLGVRIASALYTAHQHGIIHRDVKPGNVLVTANMKPVLADFGISASTYQATRAKGLSIPWAAPEIIAHKSGGSESSDIYSLGATLFGLITGKSPYEYGFHPRTEQELSQIILTQNPPHLRGGEASPDFERVLRKAMAHNREQRYFSALDFARDMQVLQARLYGQMTPLIANDTDLYPTSEEIGISGRLARHTPPDTRALSLQVNAPAKPKRQKQHTVIDVPSPPRATSKVRQIESNKHRQVPPPPKPLRRRDLRNTHAKNHKQGTIDRFLQTLLVSKKKKLAVTAIAFVISTLLALGVGFLTWRQAGSLALANSYTTTSEIKQPVHHCERQNNSQQVPNDCIYKLFQARPILVASDFYKQGSSYEAILVN